MKNQKRKPDRKATDAKMIAALALSAVVAGGVVYMIVRLGQKEYHNRHYFEFENLAKKESISANNFLNPEMVSYENGVLTFTADDSIQGESTKNAGATNQFFEPELNHRYFVAMQVSANASGDMIGASLYSAGASLDVEPTGLDQWEYGCSSGLSSGERTPIAALTINAAPGSYTKVKDLVICDISALNIADDEESTSVFQSLTEGKWFDSISIEKSAVEKLISGRDSSSVSSASAEGE